MIAAAVPLRTVVNTASAGAMLGYAVYVAQTINLDGLAPGVVPTVSAALAIMGTFLVRSRGPSDAPAALHGRDLSEPSGSVGVLDRPPPPIEAAPGLPTGAIPTANAFEGSAAAEGPVAVASQNGLSTRAANGWKMASFILDPGDSAWREMRGWVAQVARPRTVTMIDAVVTAAHHRWHTVPGPLSKDAFIADVLASPEVKALGTPQPRMDVVQKIVLGKHPTLDRAAELKRTAGVHRSS